MNQILITVVVPIYKVEEYLDECVQSIINQSYQNLEIILVDDGSPDNCGKICDEYAENDSRIKVIHKKNGGLSDARNAGIDIATGEYITFVDSDDYIHKEMIEKLYKNLIEHNADISVCTKYEVYDNGEIKLYEKSSDKLIGTTDFEKYHIMFSKGWEAWAKLYKLSLFENLRYPKGVLYEDLVLTPKIYFEAEKVVYYPQALYFYRMRSGSIMTQSSQSKVDLIYNAEDVIEFLKNKKLDDATFHYTFKYIKKELNKRRTFADKSTDIGRNYISAFMDFEKKYKKLLRKTFSSFWTFRIFLRCHGVKRRLNAFLGKV